MAPATGTVELYQSRRLLRALDLHAVNQSLLEYRLESAGATFEELIEAQQQSLPILDEEPPEPMRESVREKILTWAQSVREKSGRRIEITV